MPKKMTGVLLPGNSTVKFKDFPIPEPGPGQVLLKMKASTICGSDIRAIYREHLGKGPEGYNNVIAGHEPCGQIVKAGKGLKRFKEGDRAIVYHISGCGVCHDCRMGYQISCHGKERAAYGWQRDGGMADYCLVDESDLIALPDSLSYVDGACVACGFGTCYEAIKRIGVSGDDRTLVVGLGPMGLASLMLARKRGSSFVIGVDIDDERLKLAKKLKLADLLIKAGPDALKQVLDATEGKGCEKTIDTSAANAGRQLAIRATRQWGSCALVGEGGNMEVNPSPDLIHPQVTVYGSWVTSLGNMEDLVERMVRWDLHPDKTSTHRFPLHKAAEAYALMNEGHCGKVAVVWE